MKRGVSSVCGQAIVSLPKMFSYMSGLCLFLTAFSLDGAIATSEDHACYGHGRDLACSQHKLHCQEGTIFIVEARRGFKPVHSSCHDQVQECPASGSCCAFQEEDCLEDYSADVFQELAKRCLGQSSCVYAVPEQEKSSCHDGHRKTSGYSILRYLCLKDTQVEAFQSSQRVKGKAIALTYRSKENKGADGFWHCRVDTETCDRSKVNVSLSKTFNRGFGDHFTSLKVGKESWLHFDYMWPVFSSMYDVSSPFTVTLRVEDEGNVDMAMAVLYTSHSTELKVTCGISGEQPLIPDCKGVYELDDSNSSVGKGSALVVVATIALSACILYRRRSSVPRKRQV